MFVPDAPRFSPGDLCLRPPARPAWLGDRSWVPDGQHRLYATAKTGLLAVLRAWRDEGLRTALLPEYLPPGVGQCFRAVDFGVGRYPVDPDLTVRPAALVDRLEADDRPDLLLVVHYFGFGVDGFRRIAEAARANDVRVIEDCARGVFGRDADGRLLGATGDAAVYSLHKSLPVPNGALVIARDADLPEASRSVPESRDGLVGAALAACRLVGRAPPTRPRDASTPPGAADSPSEPAATLGRWVWPPSAPGHLSRCGLASTDPATVQAGRRARYVALREGLVGLSGLTVVSPPAPPGASPHGLVVRVEPGRADRQAVATALRRRGLPVEWFEWPLTVPTGELAAYPGASVLREQLLVLPCHQRIPPRAVAAMVRSVGDALGTAPGGAGLPEGTPDRATEPGSR